jgi:hypothetical protein
MFLSTPLFAAYPTEIWPYHTRARGVSLTYAIGYSTSTFNVFVNPIALASIGWKYYIIFVVVLVGSVAVTYFYYPETKGHSLEELILIIDGHAAPRIHGIDISEAEKQDMVPTKELQV